MKYLFSLGLVILLCNPFNSSAQDAMYSNDEFKKTLESYTEVIVTLEGFEYKYTGNWLTTMEINEKHALSFTRGKVTHTYNLANVAYMQEEGKWVKLWLR